MLHAVEAPGIVGGMTTRTLALLLAAASPVAAAAQPAPVTLTYAGYAHGLNLLELKASFDIAPANYRVQLSFELKGMVGAMFTGGSATRVDGRFAGNTILPRELFSAGHMRGKPSVTQIDWRDAKPIIMQLQPPVEEEREPVPAADQAGTVDGLSAMAGLLRRVAETGRCDSAARLFDGRRLSVITAHTVGPEVLEPTSRSSYAGPALRCDFEGQQLAGFVHDADMAVLTRVQHASAWFATLQPGAAPVPVRIRFETRGFGDAVLYLKDG